MTNEQILNERWKKIDTYLSNYLKNYKNVNQTMRDKLQTVFDSIDIDYSDINKPVSKAQKSRLDRFILDLKKKGLLTDYFGYKARLIYNKKNVTYLEMIELMITGCYIEQNKNLDEYNNILFLNTCKNSYEQGIEDISKIKDIKPISFKIPILYTLLNIPILNATAKSYLYSLALTNADELYKQVLINLQLGNKLDVDSRYYKDLFNKQDNRFININGEKLSGGIVNIVENLSNLAYLQAGIDTNTTECRFIAEIDKRTTDMCETLNNQIFKVNEMNVYQRYSDIDKRIVTYHTMGLVQGENLPPINNHFHYCRSTITYNTDIYSEDLEKIRNQNRINYKDITLKFMNNRKKKDGKIISYKTNQKFRYEGVEYLIDGKNVKIEKNEKEQLIAEWITKTLKYDVEMVPKINNPESIKTPDFIFNKEKWDLKTITGTSNQTLYHAIYNKEQQSRNFIFDITNCNLEMDVIKQQINNLYRRPDTSFLNKIIIKKDNEFYVYDRK